MDLRDPAPGTPWAPQQFWVCPSCGRHFWTTHANPPGTKPAEAKPAADAAKPAAAAAKPAAAAGAPPPTDAKAPEPAAPAATPGPTAAS
jgi:hypothetical protein